MSNKNYDWIKPGVHAWVAGLVCPVEVKILHIKQYRILVSCGIIEDVVNLPDLYQTESECLAAMKKIMKDEIEYAPSFKENNTGRFKFIDQKWVECSEDEIASLWAKWVVHPESRRFIDEDGFLVFVYLI